MILTPKIPIFLFLILFIFLEGNYPKFNIFFAFAYKWGILWVKIMFFLKKGDFWERKLHVRHLRGPSTIKSPTNCMKYVNIIILHLI